MFQPFALVVTLVYDSVFSAACDPNIANYLLCGLLGLGLISNLAIPRKYKRLQADNESKSALAKTQAPPQPAPPPPPPPA